MFCNLITLVLMEGGLTFLMGNEKLLFPATKSTIKMEILKNLMKENVVYDTEMRNPRTHARRRRVLYTANTNQGLERRLGSVNVWTSISACANRQTKLVVSVALARPGSLYLLVFEFESTCAIAHVYAAVYK